MFQGSSCGNDSFNRRAIAICGNPNASGLWMRLGAGSCSIVRSLLAGCSERSSPGYCYEFLTAAARSGCRWASCFSRVAHRHLIQTSRQGRYVLNRKDVRSDPSNPRWNRPTPMPTTGGNGRADRSALISDPPFTGQVFCVGGANERFDQLISRFNRKRRRGSRGWWWSRRFCVARRVLDSREVGDRHGGTFVSRRRASGRTKWKIASQYA